MDVPPETAHAEASVPEDGHWQGVDLRRGQCEVHRLDDADSEDFVVLDEDGAVATELLANEPIGSQSQGQPNAEDADSAEEDVEPMRTQGVQTHFRGQHIDELILYNQHWVLKTNQVLSRQDRMIVFMFGVLAVCAVAGAAFFSQWMSLSECRQKVDDFREQIDLLRLDERRYKAMVQEVGRQYNMTLGNLTLEQDKVQKLKQLYKEEAQDSHTCRDELGRHRELLSQAEQSERELSLRLGLAQARLADKEIALDVTRLKLAQSGVVIAARSHETDDERKRSRIIERELLRTLHHGLSWMFKHDVLEKENKKLGESLKAIKRALRKANEELEKSGSDSLMQAIIMACGLLPAAFRHKSGCPPLG